MDEEKYLLAKKLIRYISSGNQDPTQLSNPQQKVAVIYFSNPDTRLNLISAIIMAIKNSQNVNTQLILFCTLYNNYNHKLLPGVKKLIIPWNIFKRLA